MTELPLSTLPSIPSTMTRIEKRILGFHSTWTACNGESDEVLREILRINTRELEMPTKKEAITLAKTLMGSFTGADYPDPKIFTVALCRIFSAYPLEHGLAAIDPLSGLPSKLRFVPKLAEVKEELERLVRDRGTVAFAIKRELEEREQRRKDRARYEQEEAERQVRRSQQEAAGETDKPVTATESSEIDRDAIIKAWNDALDIAGTPRESKKGGDFA